MRQAFSAPRCLALGCLTLAATASCATRSAITTPSASRSQSIAELDIFVRNWPDDIVELALRRQGDTGVLTLARPAYERQPRIMLDSAAFTSDPEMLVAMLDSFDIWALNAPNATGAACQTVAGQRNCIIVHRDYSIVMRVRRGNRERVQRYTGLVHERPRHTARALGDFILAWARELEERAQVPSTSAAHD